MPARRTVHTFAAGNLRKVLGLPLAVLGEVATKVVPRSPGRWAVGSAFGVADGAAAVVAEATRRATPPAVTWLAGQAAEVAAARAAGVDAVARDSWRGWWATARAEVVLVTHGFGDVNRYAVSGAHVVQLWHGTPLKRLHLDSPAALRLPVLSGWRPARRGMAALYRRGTSRIGLLPVGSAAVVPAMSSAFALPAGRVRPLGEPRTDVLFLGSLAERAASARARLERSTGDLGNRRVVLFAPTWRDGAPDPGIPSGPQWRLIDDWCARTGSVLVVRPHPLSVGDYSHRSPHVVLHDPRENPEVIPVLQAVDVLVTDYSSTLVDFAVTGRPIVFFAPDLESYTVSRGLYRPYAEISGGSVQRTWAEVLDRIQDVSEPGPERDRAVAHSAHLTATYHQHTDGGSAGRVVDTILGRGSAAVPMASADAVPADPILLESFYGRNASCNPRALDAEIARRHPERARVWAVADEGVLVPPGATAVVIGSDAWRTVRDRARLVVTNDWIRDDWRPKRGQFVLQTWHGTPLKRLALSRRGRTLRQAAAVLKQSTRWSAMLAQSPAAARMLSRAYAVPRRRMWVEGYPRDDVVAEGAGADIRRLLGVDTARIVLYCPTWRDHRLDEAPPLDVPALAAGLGEDWTVVVRGHARTMGERAESTGDRVLDATRWPDVADLLAVADVLVTDYSSVMFDFSASGRPMVFHVPDLDRYREETRGFAWELGDRAPGPLTRTTAQCVAAVAGAQEAAATYAEAYAAWRAEFNPLDDGRASARVVSRLEALGLL